MRRASNLFSRVRFLLCGDELQEHHAEAVHVPAHGCYERAPILRRDVAHVPEVAVHERADVGVHRVHETRQAEVGDAGLEVLVEENAVGADVAVDDARVAGVVQPRKSAGGADGDLEARLPVQGFLLEGLVEAVVQAAVGHVLVHQQALLPHHAVAQEGDQVVVVELSERLHLRPKLPICVHRSLQPFDRHDGPVGKLPAVHHSQSAQIHHVVLAEPVIRRIYQIARCQCGELI